jgi:hypothetical protein
VNVTDSRCVELMLAAPTLNVSAQVVTTASHRLVFPRAGLP